MRGRTKSLIKSVKSYGKVMRGSGTSRHSMAKYHKTMRNRLGTKGYSSELKNWGKRHAHYNRTGKDT